MTLRYSTGLRNHLSGRGSFKNAFQGGRIEIYTGTQPATADAAVTGTLLVTITNDNGAHTAEVAATGTVTLSGTLSGSVDTLTVDGVSLIDEAVPYNTSLAQTATDLAAAINACQSVPDYTASAASAVVTITAQHGQGASANSLVVAVTTTGMTGTPTNMTGGVSHVNGLKFSDASGGAITKLASQVWEGTNVAGGTAGWYRMYGAKTDTGAIDATGTLIREDGAISTAGQQLNFSGSAVLTAAAKTTISSAADFTRTVPAA